MLKQMLCAIWSGNESSYSSSQQSHLVAELAGDLNYIKARIDELREGVDVLISILETTNDPVTKGLTAQYLLKYYKDSPNKLAKIKQLIKD